MSLNLRLRPRYPQRYFRWRGPLLWLAGLALLLASLVSWQRSWRPEEALAALTHEIMPLASLALSQPPPEPEQLAPASVVMVSSTVMESPHSEAFTADLHTFAGRDPIPWPNVNGRANIEYYIVQSGDTLWTIADRFGLDLDTLRWSNPALERNPDILPVGTELRILPVAGVYHVAVEGDTTESVATQYGVAQTDIIHYPPNALFPPYALDPGQGLIVPYGRKDGLVLPKPSLAPAFSVAWPLVGVITQGFGSNHLALDIGAPYGTTVFAADDGAITYADWAQTGYGYTVIIDHGDGRQSWYNHLKGMLLPAGSVVSRGTAIGEVGSTGHSSGPHLHFELRLNGEHVNPLEYLPGIVPQ